METVTAIIRALCFLAALQDPPELNESAVVDAPATPPGVAVVPMLRSAVLGVETETDLRITVGGSLPAPPDLPRVLCNVGHIENLLRVGPREFSARYVFPAERFPQVGLIVAEFSPGPRRGFGIVRLRATTSPGFKTDPGASVSLMIGEKEFGPYRASDDGQVAIPVVVPPGAAFGIARSVNRYGKSTEQAIDLQLPTFPRVVVAPPPGIAAGTMAEVAVFAVDATGLPCDSPSIVLAAKSGRTQSLGGGPGENRFLVQAPFDLSAGALELTAGVRWQPATNKTVAIPLVAGPPARLRLRADRTRLPIGRDSAMLVFLTAEDIYGNPVHPADAAMFSDGHELDLQVTSDGRVMASVAAPTHFTGRRFVEVEAALGATYASSKVPLANLPDWWLALIERPADAAPQVTLTPCLGFMWNFHQPPGRSVFVDALARPPGWPERLAVGLSVGYLHSEFPVDNLAGVSNVLVEQFPFVILGRWHHRPWRRLELGAGAGVGFSYSRTRVSSFGRHVWGHATSRVLEASVEADLDLNGLGHLVLGARHLWITLGQSSSADVISGNTAGLVADLGYRVGW